MDFMTALATRPVLVMDGAMGTELERRGAPMHHQAWSCMAMEDQQEIVQQIHADYAAAGARVHIANSFPLARHVLAPVGLGDRVAALNRRAVALCRAGIAEADGPQWIAGSLSTFALKSDRGSLPAFDELKANYAEQAGILAEAGVDLFCLEMLCDVEITRAALLAAADFGLPVMLGFTSIWGPDGRTVELRARELGLAPITLEAALPDVIAAIPDGCQAILATMHGDPDVTEAAFDIARRHWSGPHAVYPNSGTFVFPNWQDDGTYSPEAFAAAAQGWIDRGAGIVGGCCGIGPTHIRALTAALG